MLPLIDTDVLIDYLRGHAAARDLLEGLDSFAVSAISVAELYAGARNKKESAAVVYLLNPAELISVTVSIAERAGKLKQQFSKSHGIGLADAVIAATAELGEMPLLTHNLKHYPMFKGLRAPYVRHHA